MLHLEIALGREVLPRYDTQQTYMNILVGNVHFPKDTLSAEGRNFVICLLNRNPKVDWEQQMVRRN